MVSANNLGHRQGAMLCSLCSLASKLRHKPAEFTSTYSLQNVNTPLGHLSGPFSSYLNKKYVGLSENSVPLHPMVNDHYPYFTKWL